MTTPIETLEALSKNAKQVLKTITVEDLVVGLRLANEKYRNDEETLITDSLYDMALEHLEKIAIARHQFGKQHGHLLESGFRPGIHLVHDVKKCNRVISTSDAAKNEIDSTDEAKSRPDVIQLEGLLEIQHGKRHKNREGDHFLHDLELGNAEPSLGVSDPVGWDLKQIFKQGDAPTDQGCHIPGR